MYERLSPPTITDPAVAGAHVSIDVSICVFGLSRTTTHGYEGSDPRYPGS